jgi:peptidoglycan/LPS O-acetylase OafA/YrhL
VGLLSFSLYLWQFYFINFLDAGFTSSLHFSRPVVLCIFIVAQWTVMLSGAFVLYRLIERPGIHLSQRLRKKMLAHEEQKTSVGPIHTSTQEEAFAHEQTEPHQPAVLAEMPRH